LKTPPRYLETPLLIDCAGTAMPGIVTAPLGAAAPVGAEQVGVLILVGGPQYRIGSHRQFVLLARHLAAHGYAVLRFDRRGMGDGAGERVPFEAMGAEIDAAAAALKRACPQVRKLALWGLCDGASAALVHWQQMRDPGIAGLGLLNPWVRSTATQARALVKYYYLKRLGQPDFWRKVLSGKFSGAKAARELAGNLAGAVKGDAGGADWHALMAQALREYPGELLLVLSGQDYTAREFTEWTRTVPHLAGFDQRAGVTRCELPQADHTFSTAAWRAGVEHATLAWLERIRAGA
jgi:exosortase A-associated hydrolase 1